MGEHEKPMVTATVSVVFEDGQIDITPGEQGFGSITLLDTAGKVIYEADNIPDDFWYQLHGILQAKGFSS